MIYKVVVIRLQKEISAIIVYLQLIEIIAGRWEGSWVHEIPRWLAYAMGPVGFEAKAKPVGGIVEYSKSPTEPAYASHSWNLYPIAQLESLKVSFNSLQN